MKLVRAKKRFSCYLIFSLEIQPTFFQMVCPCCFTFYIPGKNCFQRFYAIQKIHRLKQKKTEAKSRIKCIIYSSQLLSSSCCKKSTNKQKDTVFCTFECKQCKTLIVYDTAPLEFLENKPEIKTLVVKPINPLKKESLQKVLQKSQMQNQSDSEKKEMDLESFLKGFL